ncbi:hypothetical protein [Dyadobacter sp. SG02]|nr:hypothetical protein [Dyadobacter sp. SG02]
MHPVEWSIGEAVGCW